MKHYRRRNRIAKKEAATISELAFSRTWKAAHGRHRPGRHGRRVQHAARGLHA